RTSRRRPPTWVWPAFGLRILRIGSPATTASGDGPPPSASSRGQPAGNEGNMKVNRFGCGAAALLAALSSACLPEPWDDLVPLPGPSKPHPKPPRAGGPPESILDSARRIDVELTIDPADWDSLRLEGKSLFDQFRTDVTDLEPFEYGSYRATARVDGKQYTDVRVQKMGYFGGLSTWRPSLVLNFPPRGNGLRKMVLNNTMEEPSYARE